MKKLIFIFFLLPIAASANDGGEFGEHLIWTYVDYSHTLIISGSGRMSWGEFIYDSFFFDEYDEESGEEHTLDDYVYDCEEYDLKPFYSPWEEYKESIWTIIIYEGVENIAAGAFHGCSNLSSVTLSGSVTSIDDYAFYGCSNLSSVTIPSCASVGKKAFKDCKKLSTVKFGHPIPNDEHLFPNHSNITLYVPYGSKNAYLAAPYWKEFKQIIEFNDAIHFSDAKVKTLCVANWDTNKNGELEMSEAVAVNSLGTVFMNKKDITSFDELGYFSGLKTISEGAFASSKIKNVTLPLNVVSLEKDAFLYCSVLGHLHIPAKVSSMGMNAISGCSSLTSITVDNNNATYCDIFGVLFTKDKKQLLQYPCAMGTYYYVPEGTEVIGRDAFFDAKVTEVHLPSTLKELVYDAFGYCTKLTELEMPEGLQTIGDYIFDGCSALKTIHIPSTVTSIGHSMTQGCQAITDVYCGMENPFAINDDNFTATTYANATLHVPGGTKNKYASLGGWKNFSVIKSDTTTYCTISQDGKLLTFYHDELENVRQGTGLGSFHLNGDAKAKVTKVVFDSSFADARPTTAHWFSGMNKLSTIEGMEYFNTSEVEDMTEMFSGCSSLKSLDLSHFDTSKVHTIVKEGNSVVDDEDYYTYTISYDYINGMRGMFSGCSSLKSLDLSHFDTSQVGDMSNMFSGCSSLESIDVSHFETSKVTNMEKMFYGCSSLKSIDVSHFNTSNIGPTSSRFYPDGADGWDYAYEYDEEGERGPCVGYRYWGVGRVVNNLGSMRDMFAGCNSLTSLDLSSFIDLTSCLRSYVAEMSWIVYFDDEEDWSNKYNWSDEDNDDYRNNKLKAKDRYLIDDYIDEEIPFEEFHESCTSGILNGCTSLRILTLSGSMTNLSDWDLYGDGGWGDDMVYITREKYNPACNGVGTQSKPCMLTVPSGFSFGDVNTSGTFQWHGGWFTLDDGYPLGDVNHDGAVSVIDVMMTVSQILGKPMDNFHAENADINGDGDLNVADVTGIIDIVLHSTN